MQPSTACLHGRHGARPDPRTSTRNTIAGPITAATAPGSAAMPDINAATSASNAAISPFAMVIPPRPTPGHRKALIEGPNNVLRHRTGLSEVAVLPARRSESICYSPSRTMRSAAGPAPRRRRAGRRPLVRWFRPRSWRPRRGPGPQSRQPPRPPQPPARTPPRDRCAESHPAR